MATYTITNGTLPSTLNAGDILNFPYTGVKQTISLPKGKYILVCNGAQGGNQSTIQGGYGGTSNGILTTTVTKTLHLYVGGQPTENTNASANTVSTGGFNGGGSSKTFAYSGTTTYAQGGGGASDIRIGTDSLYARVIVAGGGGGSAGGSSLVSTACGGGLTGKSVYVGYNGTQTGAGTLGSFGAGGTNTGSSGYKYGAGGGGGGWYGGGTNTTPSDTSTSYRNYAGGGSGYVYTSETAINYPSGCLLTSSDYLTMASTHQSTNTGHGSITIIVYPNFPDDGSYYFPFINSTQIFKIPTDAQKVKIETWGAEGGRSLYNSLTNLGGMGGYSKGTLNCDGSITELYVNVGGQGGSGGQKVTSGNVGGFNGGASGGIGTSLSGAGGGGASDVRTSSTLGSRIIVAGGGGGASGYITSSTPYNGYAGGGLKGLPLTQQVNNGQGGSQTSGGLVPTTTDYVIQAKAGTLGNGGNGGTTGSSSSPSSSVYGGGAGGGGYYGGSGSSSISGLGGGGSGYISPTLVETEILDGTQTFLSPFGVEETGHSGNGFIKITPIIDYITKLEITSPPRINYDYGETFVNQGIVTATYFTGVTKEFTITSSNTSGYSPTTLGSQTLTVTIENSTITYNVIIHGVDVLYFETDPNYIYDIDEQFVTKGVLKAIWDDGKIDTINLTRSMVSGFDTSTGGLKTITVNYKNATLQYEIIVREIESVTLFDEPQLIYEINSPFIEKGSIYVYYTSDEGYIIPITENLVTHFDNSEIGKSTVILDYLGWKVSYSIFTTISQLNCVYDRTYQDVEFAYNNQTLETNKGSIYYTDMNRIEFNIKMVRELLKSKAYICTFDVKEDWLENDVVTLEQMNRIRDNVTKMIIKFAGYDKLNPIEKKLYLDYIQANTLEKNIQILFNCIKLYGEQQVYCGTLYGGESQL